MKNREEQIDTALFYLANQIAMSKAMAENVATGAMSADEFQKRIDFYKRIMHHQLNRILEIK